MNVKGIRNALPFSIHFSINRMIIAKLITVLLLHSLLLIM